MALGWIQRAKREYYKRLDPLSFFTERKFIQRYRLSKAVVRMLIEKWVSTKKVKVLRGKHAVPYKIRFCVALRYFATGATYQTIGDCHGISKSVVGSSVKDVAEYFRTHISEYVVWPDSFDDKNALATAFYKKTKKPRCFGLVDGTHVPILCPKGVVNDENQFYCYKGYYSINVMIIADFDGFIFHVNAANPGSCNDIYVMNGSQVKFLGERGDFRGYYLLGDSGYVLTDYVLTPVKYEKSQADVDYNKWHRKTRSSVERTIGILKQRWRCLDSSGGYLYHDPPTAAAIIETCVALHNCARAAKVHLLPDYLEKDSFRRKRKPITQPEQRTPTERVLFKNLRSAFVKNFFCNEDTEDQEDNGGEPSPQEVGEREEGQNFADPGQVRLAPQAAVLLDQINALIEEYYDANVLN